jgi:hypothetical protein
MTSMLTQPDDSSFGRVFEIGKSKARIRGAPWLMTRRSQTMAALPWADIRPGEVIALATFYDMEANSVEKAAFLDVWLWMNGFIHKLSSTWPLCTLSDLLAIRRWMNYFQLSKNGASQNILQITVYRAGQCVRNNDTMSERDSAEVLECTLALMAELTAIPNVPQNGAGARMLTVVEDAAVVMKALGKEDQWRQNASMVWMHALTKGQLQDMVDNNCVQHRAFAGHVSRTLEAKYATAVSDNFKDYFASIWSVIIDDLELSDAEGKLPADARDRRVRLQAAPTWNAFLQKYRTTDIVVQQVAWFAITYRPRREEIEMFLADTNYKWKNVHDDSALGVICHI